jgi:hypothetical protein
VSPSLRKATAALYRRFSRSRLGGLGGDGAYGLRRVSRFELRPGPIHDVWISIYDAQAYGNQWGEFGGGFWYNQSNQCDPGPNLHWRDWVVRTG